MASLGWITRSSQLRQGIDGMIGRWDVMAVQRMTKMSDWKKMFRSHILERGLEYARKGNVTNLIKDPDCIHATVRGSEYYSVRIAYSGEKITDAFCTCPYAAKGEWCKHIAAVLYVADNGSEQSDESHLPYNINEEPDIEEIIRSADRKNMEIVLLQIADMDYKMESLIRASLEKAVASDVRSIEREIDKVFYTYSDGGRYIDYYSAMSFENNLNSLLLNRIGALIDDERYTEAFDASMYAFKKLGEWDIDDDGEIGSLCTTCCELWKRIIGQCSLHDKEYIRGWLEEHSDDGTIDDYMEDVLRDFMKYELASEEGLREIIGSLEATVDRCKDSAMCQGFFSPYYGYSIEAIELRNILARKLGATDEDIEEYMRGYMNFTSVRKYFIEKARKQGDVEEEIRFLILSKEYEKGSGYTAHPYSERLIELYHLKRDVASEKRERREDILSNQCASLEEYRLYRDMCTDEEWKDERISIIASRESVDKKCEFLADEGMQRELFNIIWGQKDKLELVNKYGFAMAEGYSGEILEFYSEYVSELAEYACNRARYDELVRYLMRMSQYSGGKDCIRRLVWEWMEEYPTRKVMGEVLREFVGRL